MRVLSLVLFLACMVLLSGARVSAADEELGTVEGTVTLNGKPLTDTTITFHLMDDQFVGAKVKDGKYRVDRVPAGTVKVSIQSKKIAIPAKYASEETTPLSVEIKKGKGMVNFDLIN
jgi:hypothetical protein